MPTFKTKKSALNRGKTPTTLKKQKSIETQSQPTRSTSQVPPPRTTPSIESVKQQSEIVLPTQTKENKQILDIISQDINDNVSSNSRGRVGSVKKGAKGFKTKRTIPDDASSFKKSNPFGKIMGFQSKIREIREKMMYRDNWNYFVGDPDFKTDTFLRFREKHIKYQYEKFILAQSAFSLRIILFMITFASLWLTESQGSTVIKEVIIQDGQSQEIQIESIPKRGIFGSAPFKFILHMSVLGAAMFATFPEFQKKFSSEGIIRRLLINLVPFCLGYHSINLIGLHKKDSILIDNEQISERFQSLFLYIVITLHNIPFFLTNVHIVSDWMEYGVLTIGFNVLYCLMMPMFGKVEHFNWKDFMFRSNVVLVFLVTIFSLFEKQKKELFVIGHTNSKSKKQLMRIFNQMVPSVIVSKDGSIQMCNERFEKLVSDQIGIKTAPTNLLKMIQNDVQAKNKLIDVIQAAVKTAGNQFQNNDPKEFELILRKDKILQQNPVKKDKDQSAESKNSDAEDKNSQNSGNTEKESENYNNKFEAFKITVSSVQFKSQKHVMLNFENLTNLKCKYRLMSMHARHIGQCVISSQRRLEVLHRQLLSNGESDLSSQVGEFLGNSQVTLNMVQQMSHYLKYNSNMKDFKTENYVLSEEIDYCLEGLTASKREKVIEVFLTKGKLPKQVLGDLRKFRICMRTLLEFAIKYTSDHQMHVKCEFKELTPEPERHLVIQFSVILTHNELYDLEPVEMLLQEQEHDDEETNENEDLSFDKQINNKYAEFSKHIRDFGLGMVVFPSVVKQLKGSYFLESSDTVPDDNSQVPQSQMTALSPGKLKVGFKIPFEPAPADDNVISKSNYKINPLREVCDNDGTQIFKTPQIRSAGREVSRAHMSNMDSVMHGLGLNTSSRAVSAQNGLGTPGINRTGGIHAAPSPANQSADTRTNMVMNNIVVGGGGAQRQQAKGFNQNGYASVNNHGFTANLGSSGARQPAHANINGAAGPTTNQSNLNRTNPNNSGQGQLMGTNLERIPSDNQEQQQLLSSIQTIGVNANLSNGTGGAYTALHLPGVSSSGNYQAHPAISAIDNSFKNMQNLQNTKSDQGTGSNDGVKNVQSMEQLSNSITNGNDPNNTKRKANPIPTKNARNTLLKNINDEGKPRVFFKKNNYQSTSTANFINGKPGNATDGNQMSEEQKNDDDSSFYLSNVQSSQKLGGSSFGPVVNSRQNIKADSLNGTNEEFKKLPQNFSFMDGMKPSNKNSGLGLLSHASSQSQFCSTNLANQINNGTGTGPTQLHQGDHGLPTNQSQKNSGVMNSVNSQRGGSDKKQRQYLKKSQSKLSDIKESNSQIIRSNEDNSILVPQSALMDGQINLKNESRNEDLDSEIKDRVDSLQNHDAGGGPLILDSRGVIPEEEVGDIDGPYNFKMEQIDSFMDSEELGMSYGSQKFRKNSGEMKPNMKQKDTKSMPLSKHLRRQIFDPLLESSGASKNLLGNSGISQSQSAEQISEPNNSVSKFVPESQPSNQDQDVTDQNKNQSVKSVSEQQSSQNIAVVEKVIDRFTAREVTPLSEQKAGNNQFMKAAVAAAGFKNANGEGADSSMNILHLRNGNKSTNVRFSINSQSQEYLHKQVSIQFNFNARPLKKQIKNSTQMLSPKPDARRFLEIWQKNILMYPPESNAEYDVMDKNQSLKNLLQIIEEIQQQEKQFITNNSNAMSPASNFNNGQGDFSTGAKKYNIFPMSNVSLTPGRQINSSSVEDHQSVKAGKQIMLIVDDNHFIQTSIKVQLEQIGVDYEASLDGYQAKEMVEKYLKEGKMFDTILMDLYMPEMDGYEASKQIRELEKKYGISETHRHFICGHSSKVDLSTEKKCFDHGMDDIVAKPMSFKALKRMLLEHDRRKIAEAGNASNSGANNLQKIQLTDQ